MKTFCITSETNYGLMFHIVNTDSEEEAREIALREGAWDYCTVSEIDTTKKGCVFNACP